MVHTRNPQPHIDKIMSISTVLYTDLTFCVRSTKPARGLERLLCRSRKGVLQITFRNADVAMRNACLRFEWLKRPGPVTKGYKDSSSRPR